VRYKSIILCRYKTHLDDQFVDIIRAINTHKQSH